MYNLVVNRFSDKSARLRYFPDHVITRKPIKKKSTKVPVPFLDDEGDVVYATKVLNEEEIAFRQSESIRCACSRARNKILKIALSSDKWKYFCTFTFDSTKVDRTDYDACSKYMQSFLKHFRADHPESQYLIVPELHSDGKSYHFHGLFSSELPVKYAGFFKKTGHTYHVVGYDIGFTTATVIKDVIRCARYISSYITKDMCAVTKGRRRYWYSFSTIDVVDNVNFYITQEKFRELVQYLSSKETFGGTYNANSFLKYEEIWFSPDMFDDIFNFVSGYDDGSFHSFSG